LSDEKADLRKKSASKMYELAEGRFASEKGEEPDELDNFLKQNDRQLIQEAKRADLETIVEQKKQRLEKVRNRSDDEFPNMRNQPQPVSSGGAGLIAALAQGGMDPTKAKEFLDRLDGPNLAKLQILSNPSRGGGNDYMLPLMMLGGFGSQPQVTVRDMLDIGPKFAESAKAMADLNRPPPNDQNQFIGLFREMITEMGEERKTRIEGKIGELQKSMEDARRDPIEQVTNTMKALKEQGLLKDDRQSSSEMDLKIEQLRSENTLKVTQLNVDLQKWMVEKDSEGARWGNMLNMLGPVTAVLSKPIEKLAENAGRRAGMGPPVVQSPIAGQPQPQQQGSQTGAEPATLQCSQCRSWFLQAMPLPDVIACPNCGHRGPVTGQGTAPPASASAPPAA